MTRDELMAAVPRWYNGVVHLVLLHAMSIGGIVYAALQLRSPRWWELGLAPAFFVFANLFEYLVHKGPLHHRTKGMGMLFDRHTLTHHAYFHHDTMRVRSLRELRFVLFPPLFLPMALVATAPIPLLLGLISPNLGWMFLVSVISYYLAYEWFHTWHHLYPESAVAAHHKTHHDPKRMTRGNFNVSFPLWDLLLRTRLP